MKNLTFTLSILAILCLYTSVFAQTIRRVNNMPGISGVNVYSTIQAAHDAAVAGDVIYVEPTGFSVGSLTCTKQLTIIGNGYLLDRNSGTPANKSSSVIGNISFYYGSNNSTLIGMDLLAAGIGTGISVFSSNVTVTRCRLGGVSLANESLEFPPNNFTISKCLITGQIYGGVGPGSGYPIATGQTISNNIFASGGRTAIYSLFNSIIINNTFHSTLGTTGGGPIIFNVASTNITNNIFDFRNAPANSSVFSTDDAQIYSNNSFLNNISLAQNGLPSGNGNINGASETITFQVVNPWLVDGFGRGYFEQDASYQLAVGSPAIGIGTGGTNAGAFGGLSPYVLSGLPPVPITTNFTTSGAGNANVPIQVSVTVRSNN